MAQNLSDLVRTNLMILYAIDVFVNSIFTTIEDKLRRAGGKIYV